MTNLHLYQPGEVDTHINFPTCWNDLSIDELKIVSRAILSAENDPGAANTRLLIGVLQSRIDAEVPAVVRRKLRNIKNHLDAEATIINLWPAIEFLFKSNDLTKQPYPKLKIKKTWLRKGAEFKGPESDFNNLTAGEFEDAESFFNQFKNAPDREPLAHLAAILFREEKVPYMQYDKDQDKLETYDIKPWLSYFRRLPDEVLYIIFLWYSGCRNTLPGLFPNCFSGGDSKDEPDPMAFTKCIHAGAGEKNGTREKIRQTLLKEFLFELELETIKNKELERMYNEHKS